MSLNRIFVVVALLFAAFSAAWADQPPNVIVLLADDLGWNALACYGSRLHETPNIDRLAKQGIRFTDAYAACTVCSPTRAAMMTGITPAKLHLTDFIPGQTRPDEKLLPPLWTKRLEHSYTTIAEALAAGGYKTAHVGKWHLGEKGFYPEDHGFEINIAGSSAGSPKGGYFLPNKIDLPGAKKGDYLTDRLTDEAIGIIEKWKDEPFFLYFPYYTVHTPIQGKPELVRKYKSLIKPDAIHTNADYAAMVQSLDESVGRITQKLRELKIADDTLIIFTSDNGGLSQRFGKKTGITNNSPLRRGKGSAYEGGVRVPLIVSWPSQFAGDKVCHTPVSTIDYYPTILAATKVAGDKSHNQKVEGENLLPVLTDPTGGKLRRDTIFWHFPHYHAGGSGPYGAIRKGDWKLIERYEDGSLELYDLANDVGEKENLAEKQQERAAELLAELRQWRANVSAQMPRVNQ